MFVVSFDTFNFVMDHSLAKYINNPTSYDEKRKYVWHISKMSVQDQSIKADTKSNEKNAL